MTNNKVPSFQKACVDAFLGWGWGNALKVSIALDNVAMQDPNLAFLHSFTHDGLVELNLATSAIKHFYCDGEVLSFEARYNGVVRTVVIKYEEIFMVRAPGTQTIVQLRAFEPIVAPTTPQPTTTTNDKNVVSLKRKVTLSVVK